MNDIDESPESVREDLERWKGALSYREFSDTGEDYVKDVEVVKYRSRFKCFQPPLIKYGWINRIFYIVSEHVKLTDCYPSSMSWMKGGLFHWAQLGIESL